MRSTIEQREIDNRDYELWVIFAQASYAIAKARHRELLELGTTQQRLGILFITSNIYSGFANDQPPIVVRLGNASVYQDEE